MGSVNMGGCGGYGRSVRTGVLAAVVVIAAGIGAGCSARPSAGQAIVPARQAVSRQTAPAASGPAAPAATGTAATGTAAGGPAAPVRVTFSRVRAADGSVIMIATITGPARYVLHDGSQDPGKLVGPVKAGPKVTGPARAQLVAAFNGGFKMTSLAGGYEQEDHVAKPIRTGLASLVIDTSGRARIGVWGSGVPAAGEHVYSVRQNLWLLLSAGQPTKESALWWRWGGTVGHAEYVARSSLGQNRAGDLIYAASMSTTPADLAWAQERAGARVAMELDINPEWVQFDAATRPGGPLRAEIPGQHRPANQYLTGWTRDFIAVQSP